MPFIYDLVAQHPTAILSYTLLGFCLFALLTTSRFLVWGSLLAVYLLLAVADERLGIIALIAICITGGLLWLAQQAKVDKYWKIVATIISISAVSMLFLHLVPAFNNLKIINGIKFSPDSTPFSMYINYDKSLAAVLVLGFGGIPTLSLSKSWKHLRWGLASGILAVLVLMGAALALGSIRFDPKWPSVGLFWLINNFVFVCLVEEIFFRGLIQGSLQKLLSPLPAVIISSAIFAGFHFHGGIALIIFSLIAGLFYGLSFARTGSILAASSAHFLVNATHFLFFSYPMLSQ